MRPDTEIYTKYVFGYRQLFVREYDDVANITHERQIWSQQGDMAPGDLLGDRLIMLDGPDAEYPEGVGGWRSRVDPTDELAIILIFGQSNGAGITTDATGTRDRSLFTVAPPMPGICLTFNGGAHPHPGYGSAHCLTAIDPARYDSFVDMVATQHEGVGCGTAETYAAALDCGTRVLLINNCFSGSSFTRLFGKAKEPAQAWLDLVAMVRKAVTLAQAAGLKPVIHGFSFNHGEANDADTPDVYAARLDRLRQWVDGLKRITGQDAPIPLLLGQACSTFALNSGKPRPAALAMTDWAMRPENYAVVIPQYWMKTDDVPTVHFLAQGHRHRDELAGHILHEMRNLDRKYGLHMLSAERRGIMVQVSMSDNVMVDVDHVSDPGNLGISYQVDGIAHEIYDLDVTGRTIRFYLSPDVPAGGEVQIAGHGAKNFPDHGNRNGLGRDYGLRSCLRSLKMFWSHTTGRPLWQWAAVQTIPVMDRG